MKRTTSILLSIGVSAVLIAAGIWFLYDRGMGMWPGQGYWYPGHHGFMGGGMGIVMILFWVVIIAAVFLLISATASGVKRLDGHREGSSSAIEILKERYARGEIGYEEYQKMRKDISA